MKSKRRFFYMIQPIRKDKLKLTAGGSIDLTRLTSHHFSLLLLLLSSRKKKVSRRKVNVGVLRYRLLSQSHSADRRHVSFRAEDKERNSERASDLTHPTKTLLIVGSGTTHED